MPLPGFPEDFNLHDYVDNELFGSVDIVGDPQRVPADNRTWMPLSNTYGMACDESGRAVMAADSNLVRPGYSGLPQGWESWLVAWRAALTAPAAVLAADALTAFAASTSARFEYGQKMYASLPLAELLKAAPLNDVTFGKLSDQWPDAVTAFFQGTPVIGTFITPIHLQDNRDFNVVLRGDPAATTALRETLTAHKATLTIRVFLRGLHKRPVV
jgi:hypothetical protein